MDESPTHTSPEHERLGALLRKARVAAGISQTELAKLLGRKQASVSKYERGSRGLDAIEFLRIVELTDCDIIQLAKNLKQTD